MWYPERSVSAAPVVVVVGASQESVATPLPTGRSCGLLVVEAEDGSLELQPTSTDTIHAARMTLTNFKAQTPTHARPVAGQPMSIQESAAEGASEARSAAVAGLNARGVPGKLFRCFSAL